MIECSKVSRRRKGSPLFTSNFHEVSYFDWFIMFLLYFPSFSCFKRPEVHAVLPHPITSQNFSQNVPPYIFVSFHPPHRPTPPSTKEINNNTLINASAVISAQAITLFSELGYIYLI